MARKREKQKARTAVCTAANGVACLCAGILPAVCGMFCGCMEERDWRYYDDELRRMVTSGDCPGYVMCTFEIGREEWSCFGWADMDASRAMSPDTVFSICSMTKSFVGALAAVLADRKAIDLDEPVSRTFPAFTDDKADITLRQCLSMTAGFVEMSPVMKKKGVNSQDAADVVSEMSQLPLASAPGTKYIYSNPSVEIAAAVIERKTGRRLEDLLAETFFIPLEMADTTFRPTQEMLSRLAVIYKMEEDGGCHCVENKVVRPPYEGPGSHVSASAGLFSTPYDIMKFYQMLLRKGLAEDGRRVMTEGAIALVAAKQTPPAVADGYSLGFYLRTGWLGHDGFYRTAAECDLARGRLRMLFTQIEGSPTGSFLRLWRKMTSMSYDEMFFDD